VEHLLYEAVLEGKLGGNAEEFFAAAAFWSSGRRFPIGENNFIGVGPSDIDVGDYVMVLKGGALPFLVRAQDEACTVFADVDLARETTKAHKGHIPNQEFNILTERHFPLDLMTSIGLQIDQIGGSVEAAGQSIESQQIARLQRFLEEASYRETKDTHPRYSLIGCSYAHGLSEGEAVLQITPLYLRDYLFELGKGWQRIFLE